MKTCLKCGLEKPLGDFHKLRHGDRGLRPDCKTCRNAKARDSYAKDRSAILQRQKERRPYEYRTEILRKYGLTEKEYQAFSKEQNGLCAVCLEQRKLVVDHCHDSGKVRGLLCRNCNVALGLLGDDTNRLQRAVTYLEQCRSLV